MKRIVVVGSLNMDTVLELSRLPQSGETISGQNLMQNPGGKGANQAYTIGKLGGNVAMIGAVGEDAAGNELLENLKNIHVDVSGIRQISGVPTGQAFISVDKDGNNSIIIIAGCNGMVTKELIDENAELLKVCDIVIMQLEIPIETVAYVKELAIKNKKLIIVDPAPAVSNIPDDFWNGIDYIKPNETELSILTGVQTDNKDALLLGARMLIDKGVKNVIVTLGEKGCMLVTKDSEEMFQPYEVKAVDTTAAGDSFTAAFALALSKGESDRDAIRFGQKVSAISVTRKGAQASIPTQEEVETYF